MTNQKLYLIPTTPSYKYEPYDYIYLVTANSDQDAYNKAKSMLDANIPQELPEYESYDVETVTIQPFTIPRVKSLTTRFCELYAFPCVISFSQTIHRIVFVTELSYGNFT